MPWPAQFGLCGVFAFLLWWAMSKTIPKISEDSKEAAKAVASEARLATIDAATIHAKAIDGLCDKLDAVCEESKGMRAEIQRGNESQLSLLRSLVQGTAKSG